MSDKLWSSASPTQSRSEETLKGKVRVGKGSFTSGGALTQQERTVDGEEEYEQPREENARAPRAELFGTFLWGQRT